jgi:hypothetical protein
MTINVTVAAAPAYSATIAVAGRNEVAAETQPLSVVQLLMGNDHVNPWRVTQTIKLEVPVGLFSKGANWGDDVTGTIPVLYQNATTGTSTVIAEVTSVLPPNLGNTIGIKGASVTLEPAAGHTEIPATKPIVTLYQYSRADLFSTGTATTLFAKTEPAIAVGPYETPHIVEDLTINVSLDPATYRYFLKVTGEGSTYSVAGLKITGATISIGI